MGRTLTSGYQFMSLHSPILDRNYTLAAQVIQSLAADLDNLFATPGGSGSRKTQVFGYGKSGDSAIDYNFSLFARATQHAVADLDNLFTTPGGTTPPGRTLQNSIEFIGCDSQQIDRNFLLLALCVAKLANDLESLFA